MKIKFYLVIYLCIFGLCISQKTNTEDQIDKYSDDSIDKSIVFNEDGTINDEETFNNMLKPPQKTLDNVKELLQLFEKEKQNGGQCFLDEYQTFQDMDQMFLYSYQNALSCYKTACGMTSKILSSEEFNQCSQKICKLQVNLDNKTLDTQTYKCLLNSEKQQAKNEKIKHTQENDNDSEQEVDSNKINDEETFNNMLKPPQKTLDNVKELLELFEREKQHGGQCFLDEYQTFQDMDQMFLYSYQSTLSCYKTACGMTSKILSSEEYNQCSQKMCKLQVNLDNKTLDTQTYKCLLNSEKQQAKNEKIKHTQENDNDSEQEVDSNKINDEETFNNMLKPPQKTLDNVKELLELFEREKQNGGQCFLDEYQTFQDMDQMFLYSYQNALSCYKTACGMTSKILSSEEFNQCSQKICKLQVNLDNKTLDTKTYKCLLNSEKQQKNIEKIKYTQENDNDSEEEVDSNKINDEETFNNMLKPQQKTLDNVKELLELFEREKQHGGQCFLDEYQTFQDMDQMFLYSYQSTLSCYKTACGMTSKILSSEEYNQCSQKMCKLQVNLNNKTLDTQTQTYQCLLNSVQKKLRKEKDSDSEQEVDNNKIKNGQQTFSAILSLLLVGFNLILF